MGRRASPRYWKSVGAYCVELGGQRKELARGPDTPALKAEAERAFHRLMLERDEVKRAGLTLGGLADLFMDWVAQELGHHSTNDYTRFLGGFVRRIGKNFPAPEVQPKHVAAWVASEKGWNPTTRHNAITHVKRVFSWAKEMGHLDTDPIVDMRKPTPLRRENILTEADYRAILAIVQDGAFRDLLVALRETGARPGEVCGLTVDRINLDAGTWTVSNKTAHATGDQVRTVYLNATMIEMSRRLLATHADGLAFRNSRGERWRRNATTCRFRRIREKTGMGKEATAYSFRHLYITDALEKGIPPATVAELVGHKDLTMIMRIYSKLKHRTQHLHDAANAIGTVNPKSDGSASRPDGPKS